MFLPHDIPKALSSRHLELLERRVNPFVAKIGIQVQVPSEGSRSSLVRSVKIGDGYPQVGIPVPPILSPNDQMAYGVLSTDPKDIYNFLILQAF